MVHIVWGKYSTPWYGVKSTSYVVNRPLYMVNFTLFIGVRYDEGHGLVWGYGLEGGERTTAKKMPKRKPQKVRNEKWPT